MQPLSVYRTPMLFLRLNSLLGSRQQPAPAPAVPASSSPAAPPPQASSHPSGAQAQASTSASEMISVLLPTAHPTQQHLPPEAAAAVAASLPQGAPPAAVAAATAAAAAAALPAPRVQPTPPPVLAEVRSLPRDSSQQPQPPRQMPDPPPTKVGAGTITKPGGVKAVHIVRHQEWLGDLRPVAQAAFQDPGALNAPAAASVACPTSEACSSSLHPSAWASMLCAALPAVSQNDGRVHATRAQQHEAQPGDVWYPCWQSGEPQGTTRGWL